MFNLVLRAQIVLTRFCHCAATSNALHTAGSLSHLRIPVPMATYQRMAISSDDLQAAQQFEFAAENQKGFCNYNRSRSDTCLADEDRCAAHSGWKQTCADPDAILKNFTFLEFEYFVLKILTDFLTLKDL